MHQTNQRSRPPHRTPSSQLGANQFAPYRPSPHILCAPRLSTIPLPDVSPISSNAGPVIPMLASSAQTVPPQVIPTNLPEHILSIIASQLVQREPSESASTTVAGLPLTSETACNPLAVPCDSALPPATFDAVPAQPVIGATRHPSTADVGAPSLPSPAEPRDKADDVATQSSSATSRFAAGHSGSSFKDGHVELSSTESFADGICVLPVLAPWEAIRFLTVACPITINDLHLILYQATKLERAVFSSIVQDTKKARCRVDINVNNLRELIIEDVRTPIGSIFDDLEALELEEILVSYTSTSALCEDEDGYCQFLEDMAQDRKPGNIIIYSNDSWYRDARAQGLQEQLEASSNWTAAVI